VAVPGRLAGEAGTPLDSGKSMQAAMLVEVRNDLSVARLIAASGDKAARDGHPTEENPLPHRCLPLF
jgi:hypothetical protein